MKHINMRPYLFAVLLTMPLVLAGCQTELTPQQKQTADFGALQWGNTTDATSTGCSGIDSDNDGYVTCTMVNKTTKATTPILCAYKTSPGCKLK